MDNNGKYNIIIMNYLHFNQGERATITAYYTDRRHKEINNYDETILKLRT